MKERYHVTGMSCSACSSHVEKAVNKLENVEKAIDLKLKLKENNLTIDDLSTPLELLASCQRSMQIEPIETVQIATPDTLPEDVQEGDEADLQ